MIKQREGGGEEKTDAHVYLKLSTRKIPEGGGRPPMDPPLVYLTDKGRMIDLL